MQGFREIDPRTSRRLVFGGLAAALFIWVVVIASYRWNLGLIGDEWKFVAERTNGGIDDFLEPYSGHVVVLLVALYRAVLEIFGLSSAAGALHVFSMSAYAGAVIAVFFYLRSQIGDYLALLAAVVLLFLGAGYDMLLWPFQACFSIPVLFGVSALLLLRREDRSGDLLACLALIVAVFTVTLGLSFLAAAGTALLFGSRTLRRSWVVLIPLGLFTLWYLTWGTGGDNYMSIASLLNTPLYVLDCFGYSLTVITGTYKIDLGPGHLLERTLAVAALLWIGFRIIRQRRIPPELVVALVAGISFWGLIGLNQIGVFRTFDQSRYQFAFAVFTILILSGGLIGARLNLPARAAVTVVAIAGLCVNVLALNDGYRDGLRPWSDAALASVISADLLGPEHMGPETRLAIDEAGFDTISAGDYFAARDRFGADVWNLDEAKQQSDAVRLRVDQVTRQAQPFPVEERSSRPPGRCRTLVPGVGGETTPVALTGELYFTSSGHGVLKTGRLSEGETFGIADFNQGWIRVAPPQDGIGIPWRINAESSAPVKVCEPK